MKKRRKKPKKEKKDSGKALRWLEFGTAILNLIAVILSLFL